MILSPNASNYLREVVSAKSFVKSKFAMIRCISGSKSAKFHYLLDQSLNYDN